MPTIRPPKIPKLPFAAGVGWLIVLPLLLALPGAVDAQRGTDERDAEGLRPQAIRLLAFDPAEPRRLYAGTAGWGVQVSDDAGRTWNATSDELAGTKIESFVFHGRNLWVATRDSGLFNIRRSHPERVLDLRRLLHLAGVDPTFGAARFGPLAVSPGEEFTVLFAGTRGSGLFRSFDGRSWGLVGSFLPSTVGALHVDPVDPSTVLAEAGGIYRSDDQGESWHRVPDAGARFEQLRLRALAMRMRTSMAAVGRLCRATIPRFVPHPKERAEIWLARCTGLLRSEDGGRVWEGVENVPPSAIFDLAVDPLSPAHVVLATAHGLVESRNGGRSWEITRRAPAGVAISAVAFADDGTLVAGTTAGEVLRVTLDGSVTTRRLRREQEAFRPSPEAIERWRRERTTAPYERAALAARPTARPTIRPGIDVHVAALVPHPDIPDLVWAGTRAGVFHSRDGGETWRPSGIGLGELEISDLEIDASGASGPGDEDRVTLWAATRGGGIYRSPSSGRAWFPSSRGLDDAVVRDLLQAPEDPTELWAATADAGVFHSLDGGRTWRSASDGLDEPGVRALAFAGGRLWAGTDAGGVFFSDDRGGTWERVGDLRRPRLDAEKDLRRLRRLGVEPDALHVRDLLGHPDDDDTLLAATLFGLFRTSDGGRSWEWLNLRLGVHGLLRHPYEEETILAATTRGLWGSRDGGTTWRLVPFADPSEPFSRSRARSRADGLEHALPPLFALAVDRDGDVFAGTDRGEVLRAGDGLGDWESVPLLDPEEVRPAAARFAPPPENDGPPDDDPALRARRDATLLAAAFDGVLRTDLHRSRRLDVLLAYEAVRRGEIPEWPRETIDRLDAVERRKLLQDDVATRVLRRAYSVIAERQWAFADGWGVTSLRFGPRGRLLAVASATDDGRRILSEIRVFDPSLRYLLSPDLLRRLGPTPHWKVLHDLGRKPAVVRPGWVLDGAGPILRWDRPELLVTRPADDRLALWDLSGHLGGQLGANGGSVGAQPTSVGPRTVRGFPAPPRTATLSADARWLAVADSGGAAWVKDLAAERALERVYLDPREIPPEPATRPDRTTQPAADAGEVPEPTPVDAAYATPRDVVLFSPAGVVAHRLSPRGVVYDDPDAEEPAREEDAATSRRLFGSNGGFDDLVVDCAGRWVVAVPRSDRRAGDGETAALLVTFERGVATGAHVLDSGRAGSWEVTLSPGGRYLAVSRSGRGADPSARIFDLSGDLGAEGPALVIDEAPMGGVRFSPDGRHFAFRGEDGEEIRALGVSGSGGTDLVPPALDALVEDLLGDDPGKVAEWFFDDADRRSVGSAKLPRGWNALGRGDWDEHGARGLLRASSPDGRWLAAAGPGRLLRLWHFDAESLGHLQPPTGGTVLDLRRYRPYPSTHATPTDLWPLVSGNGESGIHATGGRSSLLDDICRVAGRGFTAEEWEHYFGEEPYRRICAP